MDNSTYLDGKYLREKLLPKLRHVIWSASFAPERFYVQKVYVVASLVSQEEAVIRELLKTPSMFSTTQENLDWQPDDERRSAGAVYQHLQAMSRSATDCLKPDQVLLNEVESPNTTNSICSHSFRLSSLEICNAEVPKGYHIGATALQNLPGFEGNPEECEKWRKFLTQYIVEMDDESPYIVWPAGRRRVATAVVWQVQLDIVDTFTRRSPSRPSHELKRRRRYGPFQQVQPKLDYCPPEKGVQSGGQSKKNKVSASGDCKSEHKSEYRGVRFRIGRGPTGVWVAETRLPAEEGKKNKVSFGDYKSDYKAARAIDAAFHYYGKGPYNFPDSPELLETLPSLGSLKGEEKLKEVKDRAKWLADKAPFPFTSPPSSSISTAETMASPGFSRTISGESDESAVDGFMLDRMIDNLEEPIEMNQAGDGFMLDRMIDNPVDFEMNQAVDGFIILDHMMDDNFFHEHFELNPAAVDDDDQYHEERTQSSFGAEMSWLFDDNSLTQALSTATFMQYSTALLSYDNSYNMGDSGDASATQSTSQASQVPHVSQFSIIAGSRL